MSTNVRPPAGPAAGTDSPASAGPASSRTSVADPGTREPETEDQLKVADWMREPETVHALSRGERIRLALEHRGGVVTGVIACVSAALVLVAVGFVGVR